jgi:hypothetical protein
VPLILGMRAFSLFLAFYFGRAGVRMFKRGEFPKAMGNLQVRPGRDQIINGVGLFLAAAGAAVACWWVGR